MINSNLLDTTCEDTAANENQDFEREHVVKNVDCIQIRIKV